MEISSMTSYFGLETRMLAASPSPSRTTTTTTTNSRRTLNVSAKFSSRISPTSSSHHVSPLFGGSLTSDFSTHSIRPSPLSSSSFSTSRIKRNVITMVIPFVRGNALKQPPPDLASYLFNNRIVFLGMSLVPAVTELMVAEFMYLNNEDNKNPIYFYINSTGTTKGDAQLSYHAETFTIYDTMGYIQAPIFTLAVGNAWGEAALLLAAGARGNRAALPSASIMLKQPYGSGQGQASDVEIIRRAIREDKETLMKLYARHTGKEIEQMEKDIRRPKYFSPSEAVEYGIIDKVLNNKRSSKDGEVVSNLTSGLF